MGSRPGVETVPVGECHLWRKLPQTASSLITWARNLKVVGPRGGYGHRLIGKQTTVYGRWVGLGLEEGGLPEKLARAGFQWP